MSTAIMDKPATKRTRKAAQPAVVETPADAPEATPDEPTPPSGDVEAATDAAVEADRPTSGVPYPVWDHGAIRSRREGLGLSREALAKITGLSGSRIWRSETPGGDLSAEHQAKILAALDHADEHGVPDEFKKKPTGFAKAAGPTKAELAQRLGTVLALLDEAQAAKTLAQKNAIIEQAITAGTTTSDANDDPDASLSGEGVGEGAEGLTCP